MLEPPFAERYVDIIESGWPSRLKAMMVVVVVDYKRRRRTHLVNRECMYLSSLGSMWEVSEDQLIIVGVKVVLYE